MGFMGDGRDVRAVPSAREVWESTVGISPWESFGPEKMGGVGTV